LSVGLNFSHQLLDDRADKYTLCLLPHCKEQPIMPNTSNSTCLIMTGSCCVLLVGITTEALCNARLESST